MVQKTTEKKEKHQIKFSLYKLYSNMTLAAVVSAGLWQPSAGILHGSEGIWVDRGGPAITILEFPPPA